MVQVEIRCPRFSSSEIVWQPVARIRVDGAQAEVDDPHSLIDRDLPVMHPDTRRPIRWEEEPEDWARYLASTLRGPELLAVVVADTNPPATGVPQEVDRADVRVPVTARQRAGMPG
jgi:hypothetical protein